MQFPKAARYEKAMRSAYDFLLKEDITEFPIDPFEIIRRNKWGLCTYSELANEHNVTVAEICEAFQSEDGYVMFNGRNYTIAYNDTIDNFGRIRFTLMHEIGHIYLNHLVDFEETILSRSKLTEEKYKVLENEANCFARNTLAPAPLVNKLRIKSVHDLVYYFHVSQSAARTRLQFLKKDSLKAINFAFILLTQFKGFIHSVLNSKYCLRCNHYFIHQTAKFCPVCGHNHLSKRKGFDEMHYSGINLDELHRAIQCPRCQNEHIIGDYCQICGAYLVNKCTGFSDEPGNRYSGPWHIEFQNSCGAFLDGDARFCVQCGSTSTFFESGLLKSWEEENEDIRKQASIDPFADFQIKDDDLPF